MIPRCRCCNRILDPMESVRRFKFSNGPRLQISEEFIESQPEEDKAYWRKIAHKMKLDGGYVGICTTCSGTVGMVDFDQDPRNHEHPEAGAFSFNGVRDESSD